MHWVVQHNMFNEEGFVRLLSALVRMGSKFSLVKVVPVVLSPAEGRALLPLLGATGKAQLRTGLLFALGIVLTQAHWPA